MLSPASLKVTEVGNSFPYLCLLLNKFNILVFLFSQFLIFSILPSRVRNRYNLSKILLWRNPTYNIIQASITSGSSEVARNPRKYFCVPEEYNLPGVMTFVGI